MATKIDVKTPLDAVERLQSLSFCLGTGGLEETDPAKLLTRIEWGVEHIQQVEAKRTADLIEELSKAPKTTWGEVKKAVLERAFPAPVREHTAKSDAEMARFVDVCSRSGAEAPASPVANGDAPQVHNQGGDA